MSKSYILDGQRVSHDEYVKTRYEDLRVRVAKGEKAEFLAHATIKGESLNGFVNRAIRETMERDKQADYENNPD